MGRKMLIDGKWHVDVEPTTDDSGPHSVRPVHHTHFKCNYRRIIDYQHLWPYLRDTYSIPGIAATVDFDHITQTYRSKGDLNPRGIIPIGPDLDLTAPHDRDQFPGDHPAD